jgi:hypothetical protein
MHTLVTLDRGVLTTTLVDDGHGENGRQTADLRPAIHLLHAWGGGTLLVLHHRRDDD